VTSTAVVKITPISAEEAAMSSQRRLPVARKAMLPTNTTANARKPIHAEGTWM